MSILRVNEIQHSNGTAALTIDSSGRVLSPNKPQFLAYGVSPNLTPNNTIIFPSTIINNGNHYNTTTGKFTAPVSGNYYFFWSFIGNITNDVYRYTIRLNDTFLLGAGTIIGTPHLRLEGGEVANKYADNGAFVFILPMSANDTADIFFSAVSASTFNGGNFNWWGGFLL